MDRCQYCKEIIDDGVDCDCLATVDTQALVFKVQKLEERSGILEQALTKILPRQDPLLAELYCDFCGATFDPWLGSGQNHKSDCPWLIMNPDADTSDKTRILPTKSDIAIRLTVLSILMSRLSHDMKYVGGFGPIGKHGTELGMAAEIAQGWAIGIRNMKDGKEA